jgi:hypothetical protein
VNDIDNTGFNIHKKTISFCATAQDGRILDEGTIPTGLVWRQLGGLDQYGQSHGKEEQGAPHPLNDFVKWGQRKTHYKSS